MGILPRDGALTLAGRLAAARSQANDDGVRPAALNRPLALQLESEFDAKNAVVLCARRNQHDGPSYSSAARARAA